jgi:hypothetical protein
MTTTRAGVGHHDRARSAPLNAESTPLIAESARAPVRPSTMEAVSATDHRPDQRRDGQVPIAVSSRPWLLIAVGTMVCCVAAAAALVAWARRAPDVAIWAICYGSALSGFVVTVILRLFAVVRELQDARRELARAAAAQERLRFARDVHDLLGHTLLAMVVKAQAVRKLAARDPALAAEQAADIESVGRQALTEVRESVSACAIPAGG